MHGGVFSGQEGSSRYDFLSLLFRTTFPGKRGKRARRLKMDIIGTFYYVDSFRPFPPPPTFPGKKYNCALFKRREKELQR